MQNYITFEVETEAGKKSIAFDQKLLSLNIGILNNNHSQPYPIPKEIINTLDSLLVMKQFVESHNYCMDNFKVNKPIKSSNFQLQIDNISYKVLSKFSNQKYAEQASKLVLMSKFMGFNELFDACRAAIAVNFYIGTQQKHLQQFIKQNGLENISSEEISDIIKQNEEIFTLIQLKAKQQIFHVPNDQL